LIVDRLDRTKDDLFVLKYHLSSLAHPRDSFCPAEPKQVDLNSAQLNMLNLHKDHLASEGFTPKAIEQLQTWGVRSITNQEAKNLGITYQGYSPSGLWFPFQGTLASFGAIDSC
jgi:hypothetical protein